MVRSDSKLDYSKVNIYLQEIAKEWIEAKLKYNTALEETEAVKNKVFELHKKFSHIEGIGVLIAKALQVQPQRVSAILSSIKQKRGGDTT